MISKIFKAGVLAVSMLTMFSCGKDDITPDVVTPNNPVIDKGHEEWDKVEVIITRGDFSGNANECKAFPKKQVVTFKRDANAEVFMSIDKGGFRNEVKAVEVEAGANLINEKGDAAVGGYSVEIVYYNKAGERMNKELLTEEQRKIHQHFFLTKDYHTFEGKKVGPSSGRFVTDAYSYVYRDTKVEDKAFGADNPIDKDPVGLKGFMFFKKGEISFDLNIVLSHFHASKYKADGSVDEAINPSVRYKASAAEDLSVMIPFVVHSSGNCDKVFVPKDEHNHEHSGEHKHEEDGEEWDKVVIKIREGHLHGTSFHGNPEIKPEENKILPRLQVVTITRDASGKPVVNIEKGASLRNDLKAIEVQSGLEDLIKKDGTREPRGPRYSFEITYYNKAGEVINSEFLSEEGRKIHQHFFTVRSYKGIEGGNEVSGKGFLTDVHDYTYRDTRDPEKMFDGKDNPLLKNDPVGFKGYVNFKKSGITFDLNIALYHFNSSKFDKEGNAENGINPSARVMTQPVEFSVNIPVVVVGMNGDDTEAFFKEIAKFYKITVKEIEDIFWDMPSGHESGGFWM